MAMLCNYYSFNSTLLHLPKLLHINFFIIMITFFFFLIIIPHATPLDFNFPQILTSDINRKIVVTNDAYVSPQGGLQVTPNEIGEARANKVGRARYIEPMHLWDNASQKLADFVTHFSFVISSDGLTNQGDGLAFFLVSNFSNFDDILVTRGAGLGLPVDNVTFNSTTTPFLAVEFDTYRNPIDPVTNSGAHVGIDVNSMTSINYKTWSGNISRGDENEARISYNSSSKILSVVFASYFNNAIVQRGNLSYKVDLRNLTEWVAIGFSASTGASFESHTVKSWNFSSTDPVPVTPSPKPTGKKENKTALVVGLSVGSCVLLLGGLGLIAIFLRKKRSTRRGKQEDASTFVIDVSLDDEFEKGVGPKKFSYGELAHLTNNFADEEKLGEGGFGGVYRGFSKELASYVAVKRVSKGSKQGLKEYASEVKIIGKLRHKNLVQLIGWCHQKNEMLLVYELMPHGSLDSHLFKGKSLLTWATRYNIVQGLASALFYLQEGWEQCVLHRDIKSSNIMLDSNFNAKLGDFGLARLVDNEKGLQTTMLAGTMGYMAPECFVTGTASKESDVFSFGVVTLEIACGRKPIELRPPETQSRLVEWVWNLYGTGKLLEAADPKLNADFDEQEMTNLLIVGLWCAHPDYNLRPSIRQVIQVLNYEAPLPVLPSKMPVPTYSAPADPVTTTASSLSISRNANVSESSQIHFSSQSYNTNSSNFTTDSASSSPSRLLLPTR